MPGFDKTGPEGRGSQTGRGLGRCKPNNENNDQLSTEDYPRRFGMNRGRGLARFFRFGKGRGMGSGSGRRNF